MTDPTIPEMRPSAEERTRRAFVPVVDEDGRVRPDNSWVSAVTSAINTAYRDGAAAGVLAGHAQLLAALRKPSDELVSLLSDVGFIDGDGSITRKVLRAAASFLENLDGKHDLAIRLAAR